MGCSMWDVGLPNKDLVAVFSVPCPMEELTVPIIFPTVHFPAHFTITINRGKLILWAFWNRDNFV